VDTELFGTPFDRQADYDVSLRRVMLLLLLLLLKSAAMGTGLKQQQVSPRHPDPVCLGT
jgi:hypothetical protein